MPVMPLHYTSVTLGKRILVSFGFEYWITVELSDGRTVSMWWSEFTIPKPGQFVAHNLDKVEHYDSLAKAAR